MRRYHESECAKRQIMKWKQQLGNCSKLSWITTTTKSSRCLMYQTSIAIEAARRRPLMRKMMKTTMDFTHLPNVPCRVFVVNESEFLDRVATAVSRLQSDGLVIEMANSFTVNINGPAFSSNNDVAKLIKKIEKCMKICHHALYRSEVYTKPEGASFTFVIMMDVSSYLHKLLANELLRDQLITHFQTVEKILSHPACEIIQQIKFDVNLIEVSNGYCFSIKSRKFIESSIAESMQGKLSPRSFVRYNCCTPPEPFLFAKVSLTLLPMMTREQDS